MFFDQPRHPDKALMVNSPIYVSCIKQFWASVSIKKSNDAVKLQALIDRKKVIIIEDTIRQALRLDDADGIDCLPNEEIFAELSRMGYEKPSTKGLPGMNLVLLWPRLSFALPRVESLIFQNTFDSMDDAKAKEDEDDNEVAATSTPPSPTSATTPPSQQEPIPLLPQAQHAQPSLPPQQQPIQPNHTSESSMTLLTTLMETWEDVTAVKDINAAESKPTVFDDEKLSMTVAQTLIKMKAKKQRILDEQMAKRLQNKEIGKVAARERQEKDDLKRAKRKPISVAQAKKNMIVYLKNMAGYKIQHFNGITYDQVRPIFKREYKHVLTFLKSDKDEEPTKKRPAKETLLQESFKKLREEVDVLGSHSTQEESSTVDPDEISQEDIQNMLQIVPMAEFKIKALQAKYPLFDWEIYSEGSITYWRMIRVGRITQAFQSFKDMLKDFDRDDLDALWRITKEKFNTTMPTHVKEKALWAELTRLSCILTVEYIKYLQQQEEGSRTYWRMIRVGRITQAFQSFKDMLKDFDRDDLDALWRITKEKFNTTMPTHVKEKSLWAELTRLYEPNADDALEIVKLKQRVKKLEKKRRSKSSGLKRLRKDVTAVKDINTAESKPTVFDDEKLSMTVAQTLIKMKAKKQRIIDEQMAKRLQNKEIGKVAARERQKKDDLKRAKVL
nr:hypothetical protein [Tanacetum cinerariifolium]